MTRITNSEQVVLLLRAQLQKLEQEKKLKKSGKPSKKTEAQSSSVDRMQLIARLENLSDADRERAIVTVILTEEFGTGLANDPKFIAISSEVYEALSQDDAGRALLHNALDQILKPDSGDATI